MKLRHLTVYAIVAFLPLFGCSAQPSVPTDISIPGWLRQLVSAGGRSPPIIEKATYKGQPAFNLIATDRFDTGDEHALYSKGGILICRYGGYVGRVTSGSCDLDEIVYVSILYTPIKR